MKASTVRARKAGAGQPPGASVRRSVGTPTALRCSDSWPRCRTPSARCARCGQTPATSQMTKRAARAGPEPCAPRALQAAPGQRPGPSPGTNSPLDCLCPGSASQARPAAAQPRPCGHQRDVRRSKCTTVWARLRGGQCRGEFATARSGGLGVGARSALRDLTRRNCLTTASAASGGSFSARPRDRAPQRTPRSGASQSEPRRWPPRSLACAQSVAQIELRTLANAPNGSQAYRSRYPFERETV